MDLKSYGRWYDYSRARDAMFEATDSGWAPWYAVHSNDKRKARLAIIGHILESVPYKKMSQPKIELPKRQKRGDYDETRFKAKFINEEN